MTQGPQPAGDRGIRKPEEPVRSRWRQTWINLRVWMPFLLNKVDLERQVTYWSRENRDALAWRVALPAQCFACGRQEELQHRDFRYRVRSFDSPIPLVTATLTPALTFMLIGIFIWPLVMFPIAFVWLALGGLMIFVKSWTEDVRVIISACADHVYQFEAPDVAVDRDQLYHYAPSAKIAEAAIDEQKSERRKGSKKLPPQGGVGKASDRPPAKESDEPAYPRFQPKPTADLPPLKLAGDEDE